VKGLGGGGYRLSPARSLLVLSLSWVSPNASAAQEPIRVTAEQVGRVEQLVTAYHDVGLFNGVVVVAHDGEPILETAYGYANLEWGVPNTPDTKFALASLTKQFTAAAIMLLVEDGKIDLDAPVATYLPGYRDDIASRVTVHQLLNHTSCIPEETAYMIEERTDRLVSKERLFGLINRQSPVIEAGSQFSYNNVGYILLSLIVESVSGVDFARFLEQRIFGPLGMDDTGFAPPRGIVEERAAGYARLLGRYERPAQVDDSWYRGAGGLYSTARDLVKWDVALHEHALLSEAGSERMFEPGEYASYGYGWSIRYYWVEGDKRKIVSHEGGGPGAAAVIDRFLDDRVLIVLLSNMRHSQVGTLSRQVGGIVLGAPAPPPPGQPIDDELQRILLNDGLEGALAFYEESEQDPRWKVPRSGSLNRMGYEFLRSGRVAEALQLFRLYTTIYTNIANAHDSFAEAHLVAGARDSAITYYRKAVDLDLGKVNALFMLRHLGEDDPARITDPLLRTVLDEGVHAALARYPEMVGAGRAPGEFYINSAGYNLLRHDRAEDSLALFQFNVAAFPVSANTWDSLGEAHATLGQTDEAIAAYRKSLELDPGNRNAARMLERLQAEKP
jgi:CubicO group peptidase (beta-lactamase class C family)